jgi:hypothetical protein
MKIVALTIAIVLWPTVARNAIVTLDTNVINAPDGCVCNL